MSPGVNMLNMKTCRVCKEKKDKSSFGTNGTETRKDGTRYLKTICRTCDAARRRAEHKKNPEKIRSSNREHYQRNKQKYIEKSRKFREENPEIIKKQVKDWSSRNKKHIRNYTLQRKYGITIEEYERMKEQQNKKCYICEEEKKLVVDHCHDTGKVRKLLCNPCNTFIGKMGKDIKRTYKGLHYMEEHRT